MTAKSFLASALLSVLVLAPASAPAADSDPIVVPATTPISQAYEGLYVQLLQRVVRDGSGSTTQSHLVISNDELGCESVVYDKRLRGWRYPREQGPWVSCAESNGAINEIFFVTSFDGIRLPPAGKVFVMPITRKLRPGETAPLQGLVASNDSLGCLLVVAMRRISPDWSADMSGRICTETQATLVVNGRVIGRS